MNTLKNCKPKPPSNNIHIVVKLKREKEDLKRKKWQKVDLERRSIRMRTDFSLLLKLSKENNCQPRILYSAKLIQKNKGKVNPF